MAAHYNLIEKVCTVQ